MRAVYFQPMDAKRTSTPRWVPWAIAGVALATTVVLLWMGQPPFGPDGRFAWWDGDIWSPGTSQRFADPYSFSHVGHGLIFFGLLWAVARKRPVGERLFAAVVLEAGWEILENSPIIINRYRESTIAQGYTGDSVLNSMSDLLMMALGFAFAAKAKPWMSAALFVAMELGCLIAVRDNLTLNVIMLLAPIEAIKAWQLKGRGA